MDGRRFRKWCVFGCLVVAATGCNRNSQQGPLGQMPQDTLPVTGVPMQNHSKSLWNSSKQPNVTVPIEMAPEVSKKPPSAETLVALADTQLEAAFDERTVPGSREALLDKARLGYQKALKLEPKNKVALLGIARFYAKAGEREKAIEAYKKYLTKFPKDADVAHEVAIMYARWKDFAGAVSWCEHALKLDPENRAVKKTLGFCLARAGKWEEGFVVLCQIMPEAQARHNLAGLLDHMGHHDASKMQLQLAVKADPNYAPARDFLAELDNPQPVTDPNPVRPAAGT
ncbi:MAG: tetratricopeptide repeat protein, partial [Planctomycetia bacterium]|nr:tetratricopeptide repeat protein [Planctomycetia bacterium]